jgi:hypothetical protein
VLQLVMCACGLSLWDVRLHLRSVAELVVLLEAHKGQLPLSVTLQVCSGLESMGLAPVSHILQLPHCALPSVVRAHVAQLLREAQSHACHLPLCACHQHGLLLSCAPSVLRPSATVVPISLQMLFQVILCACLCLHRCCRS